MKSSEQLAVSSQEKQNRMGRGEHLNIIFIHAQKFI
jgi:hypothetical protein